MSLSDIVQFVGTGSVPVVVAGDRKEQAMKVMTTAGDGMNAAQK